MGEVLSPYKAEGNDESRHKLNRKMRIDGTTHEAYRVTYEEHDEQGHEWYESTT